MHERLKCLLTADQIQERVRALGEQVTRDYAGRPLVLVCVLKGAFVFAADLARAIDLPLRVEFLGVRSYGADTASSGNVQITHDLTAPVGDQDLLIVEDIVDTGLSSHFLLELVATRKPRSVKLCALLHKPARMVKEVGIDYLGFTIDDVFVVGYGLDHDQRYRNLPCIATLEPGSDRG